MIWSNSDYRCGLAMDRYTPSTCNTDTCPLYQVWKILANSTGVYLGKDMTGI